MIRLDDRTRDALAAEYVLGTQTGRVRRRMARLLEDDPALAERVAWWNEKLAPMADNIEPAAVPPWLWRRIEDKAGQSSPEADQRKGWWHQATPWRWSTALAGALVVALLLAPPPEPATIEPTGGVVLVLTDEESRTAWLVSRQSAESPLTASPVQLPVLSVEQAYELWLLPPDADPMSVGLLSDSEPTEIEIPESVSELLAPGLGMAVSVEPPGGSPTGAPTGPIVFTGSIKSL